MHRRAFTLVEVTVVLAVLAMMAAVLIPRFAALKAGQDSRDFVSDLLRLGSEARLHAVESGVATQVVYNEDQRTLVFQTTDPETLVTEDVKTVGFPAGVELTAFTLDGAFTTSGDWMLTFYPDGSGFDAGVEVLDGDHVFHVTYSGRDGTSQKVEGPLEEASGSDWQAGELEQRI